MNEGTSGGPRLVVGVDFSLTSACALREARRLGAWLKPQITPVHVLTTSFNALWEPDEAASAWLQALAVPPTELEIRAGRTWSELARAAEERGATAIVIGSHGASGYQPIALGSTATRLTLIAPCPVLIVSPRAEERRAAAMRSTTSALRSPNSEVSHSCHDSLSP